MSFRRVAVALSFIALSCCTNTTMITSPATLFVGTVVSGAEQTPRANYAVLVRGETIAAVGPADELRRANPGARVVDAAGATILPGLTDAHGHLYGLGLALDTVNLVGSPTYDAVIAKVKERAARAEPNEWVLGRGWDQNRWPDKQFPTAAPLDA